MERKFYTSQIKGVDDDRLLIEAFISTEKKDRGGDIMRADGMRVEGRPTVLFSHGMSPQIGMEPVGKPLTITKDTFRGYPGIKTKIEFYPDATGRRLYEKVKGGYIHSFSIGYLVNRFTPIDEGRGRDVTDWTLLEMSLVSVPMQVDAQVIESNRFEGFQFKMVSDESVLGKLAQRVEQVLRQRARPSASLTPSSRVSVIAAIRETFQEAWGKKK